MSFTTVLKVKEYLNLKGNNEDTLLERLIDSCAELFKNYCNKDFELKQYVEFYDGNNLNFICVKNMPIVSVQNVEIEGVNVLNFKNDDIRIVLPSNRFKKGILNCKISYTAGFATIPKDLEQALIEMVGIKYKQVQHLDQVSKNLATENVTYIQDDIPSFIKIVLNDYRKVF